MAQRLYRIVAPHFTAGMVVDSDSHIIVRTAPILAWSRGKDFNSMSDYCERKKWTITLLSEE